LLSIGIRARLTFACLSHLCHTVTEERSMRGSLTPFHRMKRHGTPVAYHGSRAWRFDGRPSPFSWQKNQPRPIMGFGVRVAAFYDLPGNLRLTPKRTSKGSSRQAPTALAAAILGRDISAAKTGQIASSDFSLSIVTINQNPPPYRERFDGGHSEVALLMPQALPKQFALRKHGPAL
jgi:hypothetical protein